MLERAIAGTVAAVGIAVGDVAWLLSQTSVSWSEGIIGVTGLAVASALIGWVLKVSARIEAVWTKAVADATEREKTARAEASTLRAENSRLRDELYKLKTDDAAE